MGNAAILESHTFRLFKGKLQGSVLSGVASILDLSDSTGLYNFDKTDHAADRNAICSDWKQVGADLTQAIDEYAEREINRN